MEYQKLADVIARMADLQNATLNGVYNSKLANLTFKLYPNDKNKTSLIITLLLQLKALVRIMDIIKDDPTLNKSIQFEFRDIMNEIMKEFAEAHITVKN